MPASQKELCTFCRLPRATLKCEACDQAVCRSCVEHLNEEAFEFLSDRPDRLKHLVYCLRCHDEIVSPALETYNQTLERAKNVGYWPRTYRGHIPVLKKALDKVRVETGRDHDEVLLRLGFMAAEQGFNGLILGEITSRKVRTEHGYQKMEWKGHATPCLVDEEKLSRAEFREQHWRVLPHR